MVLHPAFRPERIADQSVIAAPQFHLLPGISGISGFIGPTARILLCLIGIPAGEALVQELRRMGMMAAVIGQTNAGNDRMLYYNGNGRYLERPAKDEIYKILP